MKNLFLSVVLLLTVSFAFAANSVEKISTTCIEESFELNSSIEIVNSVIEMSDFTYQSEGSLVTKYIRWCHYHNGTKYCTEWVELLDEIQL
jgi:hypothetical protein